jgi:hypothetical protein
MYSFVRIGAISGCGYRNIPLGSTDDREYVEFRQRRQIDGASNRIACFGLSTGFGETKYAPQSSAVSVKTGVLTVG